MLHSFVFSTYFLAFYKYWALLKLLFLLYIFQPFRLYLSNSENHELLLHLLLDTHLRQSSI